MTYASPPSPTRILWMFFVVAVATTTSHSHSSQQRQRQSQRTIALDIHIRHSFIHSFSLHSPLQHHLHPFTMLSISSSNTFVLALVLAAAGAGTADAFGVQRPTSSSSSALSPVATHHSRRSTTTTTSLNLLPTQGSQLVAACNAAYCPSEDTPATSASTAAASTVTPAAARAFVARVFSLPSSMIRRHPLPKMEGLPADTETTKDVTYFPVVGFQYVRDAPHHCTALPTVSNPSCRLPTAHQNSEPVFGWFTAACPLDLTGNLAAPLIKN